MITCTECGLEIEAGTKYLAGRWVADFADPHLDLFWACMHNPAENAVVRLGSKDCVESFCRKYPQHIISVIALMAVYESEDEPVRWKN